MFTDTLKDIEEARAKLAALEAAAAADLDKELVSLPSRYGFADAKAFLAAFKAANGSSKKPRGKKAKAAAPGGSKRRQRATITDETRAEVKKLTEAGRTGLEIAKAVGISLPSVQNVKKALGLVKKKK